MPLDSEPTGWKVRLVNATAYLYEDGGAIIKAADGQTWWKAPSLSGWFQDQEFTEADHEWARKALAEMGITE